MPEWAVNQGPIFIILVAFGSWVAFKAFPGFMNLQKQLVDEMKKDNALRREENIQMRLAVQELTYELRQNKEAALEQTAVMREKSQ